MALEMTEAVQCPQWTEPFHNNVSAQSLVQLHDNPVKPNQTMYQAMRNDHAEVPITDPVKPNGTKVGETHAERLVIRHCLAVNKIHWGILEHPQLTFGLYGFPRYALLQLRTHRNSTWDVQSLRETGRSLADAGAKIQYNWDFNRSLWDDIKQLFNTTYYEQWHADQAERHVARCFALEWFNIKSEGARVEVVNQLAEQLVAYHNYTMNPGFKQERGRGIIGDSVRCNAYVSLSLRHLLHLGSVRLAGNAQDCTRYIVCMMLHEARQIFPQIIEWFHEQEPEKLTLSP